MCLPVSRLFWVSSLAYPNLLGTKGYVVVVVVVYVAFSPRTENLVEDLLTDFEVEVQVPYLMYRNAADEIIGIWFYDPQECQEVAHLFSR
jgi:hypothetical protein